MVDTDRYDRRERIIVTEAERIRLHFECFKNTLGMQRAECEKALLQYRGFPESDQNMQDWIDLQEFHNNFLTLAGDVLDFFEDETNLAIRKALAKSRLPKLAT